jgi:hypothetical protein
MVTLYPFFLRMIESKEPTSPAPSMVTERVIDTFYFGKVNNKYRGLVESLNLSPTRSEDFDDCLVVAQIQSHMENHEAYGAGKTAGKRQITVVAPINLSSRAVNHFFLPAKAAAKPKQLIK